MLPKIKAFMYAICCKEEMLQKCLWISFHCGPSRIQDSCIWKWGRSLFTLIASVIVPFILWTSPFRLQALFLIYFFYPVSKSTCNKLHSNWVSNQQFKQTIHLAGNKERTHIHINECKSALLTPSLSAIRGLWVWLRIWSIISTSR